MSVGGPRDVMLVVQKTLEAAKAQKVERSRWDVEHDAFAASMRQAELPIGRVADTQKATGRRVDEEKPEDAARQRRGRARPGADSGTSAASGGASGRSAGDSPCTGEEKEGRRLLDVRG